MSTEIPLKIGEKIEMILDPIYYPLEFKIIDVYFYKSNNNLNFKYQQQKQQKQ